MICIIAFLLMLARMRVVRQKREWTFHGLRREMVQNFPVRKKERILHRVNLASRLICRV